MATIDWSGLLTGELILTMNVLLGLGFGELLLRLGIADRLSAWLMPGLLRRGVPPVVGTAIILSVGSSRAGTAFVARAYETGRLGRRETLWGTLLLAFPGYLRRWITTFPVAFGLAGISGAVYETALLIRSGMRFLLVFFLLGRGERAPIPDALPDWNDKKPPSGTFSHVVKRTLPVAWTVFALAWIIAPWLENALREIAYFVPLLPPAGWTVVAAGVASSTASMAATGAAVSAGDLSTAEGVFALLVGNFFGMAGRTSRQNGAFWTGIFPGDMVRALVVRHVATLVPLALLTVFFSAAAIMAGW